MYTDGLAGICRHVPSIAAHPLPAVESQQNALRAGQAEEDAIVADVKSVIYCVVCSSD